MKTNIKFLESEWTLVNIIGLSASANDIHAIMRHIHVSLEIKWATKFYLKNKGIISSRRSNTYLYIFFRIWD